MTRKPARRAIGKNRPIRARATARPRNQRRDPLDDFIAAAALALDLPAEKSWLPAIKANLRVILQHADSVAAFDLPDDAEPAPVFRA
jgi:hypothetical protein